MRDDEQDPNKPRPVRPRRKKRTSSAESAESFPWSHIKDDERDRHRHVC